MAFLLAPIEVEILFVKFDNFLKVVKFAKRLQRKAGFAFIEKAETFASNNFLI
jgi:hypothetical protein